MPEPVEEWAAWRTLPALQTLVAGYTGYRQKGMPPATHRGLPSPYLTLIVTLDDPLVVAEHPDPAQPGGVFETLVGGLHTRPATIVHEGAQSGLQVRVTPLGARALLGLPAGELANLDVAADTVLGGFAGRVQDAVRAARTWAERFAAVDALLLRRLRDADGRRATSAAVHPDVVHVWRAIEEAGGRVRVDALAREVGRGERHLRALFSREIGLSPKEAARVVRFDRARRLVAASSPSGAPSLADVAVRCGYFDQAHLDRDFRRFAGAAPTRWLADELRNVQVPRLVGDEGWTP